MGRLFGTERYASPAKLFEIKYLDRQNRSYNEAVIRSLCAPICLGEGRMLCRVLGRYKMFVDSEDIGLSTHLMLDGYWEMWLTEAISEVVKPGMTVVDVGANLGYFTLLMADLVGARGRVHAFEPNPLMIKRMQQSIEVNGFSDRVDVHQQALSNVAGKFRLSVTRAEPKNGYLVPCIDDDTDCLYTRRLDSFPDLMSADVVKIDADMSEMHIWQGMDGLLSQGRPITIFLEFSLARYVDPGAFIEEILGKGLSLSFVSLDHGIEAVDKEKILAADPKEDLMLVLSRGSS